jgi:hypothetical protein
MAIFLLQLVLPTTALETGKSKTFNNQEQGKGENRFRMVQEQEEGYWRAVNGS